MKDIQASLKDIGDGEEGALEEEQQATNELTDEESDSDEDEDLGGHCAITKPPISLVIATPLNLIDTHHIILSGDRHTC